MKKHVGLEAQKLQTSAPEKCVYDVVVVLLSNLYSYYP
jgi:hypothetical protein